MHMEALEPRALLTAPTAAFVSATTTPTALFVNVNYHADQGLDMSTIGAGDLQATTNGQPVLSSNVFGTPSTLPNGDTRVTYLINAYNGAWNYTHTGTYSVTSPAGQVKDLAGQNLQNTGIASLWLWFTTPKARITTTTVNAADWLIVVNYTDDTAIDTSTIDNNDISVVGAGLFPGITRQSLTVNSSADVTAVYRVPAPAGGWNYNNTGTFTVSTVNNQVADTGGNPIPAFQLASYYLWFDKPAAEIQATTVTATQWTIPIKYSGRAPIDSTSIADGDILVTANNGYSQAGHLVNTLAPGDGSIIATYTVPARGGAWDWTDNASSGYSVTMVANRVHDTSNRFVAAGTLQTFGLWFNNPAANMVTPTSPTLHQWDIQIDFSDNGTLDTSSITANAIRVVSPSGNLSVSLLGTAAGPNGATRATFRLTSVDGLANGHYEVWTNPNQVHDTQNSFVNEVSLASFWLWF
jgi:hypothetical protein